MKEIDPRAVLEAFVARHGTQRAAAVALGVSQAYVSDLLQGRRSFSSEILTRLGLRWVVVKA